MLRTQQSLFAACTLGAFVGQLPFGANHVVSENLFCAFAGVAIVLRFFESVVKLVLQLILYLLRVVAL